jgi:hypothetical protein
MKERIENLILALNTTFDDPDDREIRVEYVKDMLSECARYVHKVVGMEQNIQMARFRMEPCEYREYVMSLDTSRRILHNALMGSIDVCNRMCAKMELPLIAPDVNADERETYSNFAFKVVEEYFNEEVKK